MSEKNHTEVETSVAQGITGLTKEKKGHLGRREIFVLDEEHNRILQSELVNEYAKTIAVTGVDKPILVKAIKKEHPEDEQKYLVIDGYHRMKACDKVIAAGGDPGWIKFEIDNTITDEMRDILMIRRNTNANLLPIDEADIYSRLVSKGYKQNEIASKTGKTAAHVSQILLLANAPKELKEYCGSALISSTLLMHLVKQEDCNWTNVVNIVRTLVESKKEAKAAPGAKGKTKVTQKDVEAAGQSKKISRTHKRIDKIIEVVKAEETYDKAHVDLFKAVQKAVDLIDADPEKARKYILSKFNLL